MSYCKNCGTELPNGARFCAACGTPAESMPPDMSMQSALPAGGAQPINGGVEPPPYGGMPVQGSAQPMNGGMGLPPYGGMPVQGNAQPMNGGMEQPPYPGVPVQGNAGAMNGDMGLPPYGGMPVQGGAQPINGGMGLPPYGGMPVQGSAQPINGGAGLPPYGTAQAQYANGQAPGGGYPAAGPYGAAPQPEGGRKTLAIIGTIVGLIVVIAVILLIVLLTRDNSHRTYQQAVGVFMDGMKKQDLGRVCEAFPERLREEVRHDMLRFYDSEREFWEEYNESLEWFCGKNVKTTYQIADAEPLLDYQIEDYEKDCLEDFHYDVTITDGYTVEIEVTYRGSEGEYRSDQELDVVRIDGKWYVIGY